MERTLEELRAIQQTARETSKGEKENGEEEELRCVGYACDVTQPAQVYQVAARMRSDLGRDVTILVNNAGVASGRGLFLDTPDELVRKTYEVCLQLDAQLLTILQHKPD